MSHSCANALCRYQAPSHLRGLVLDDLSAVALSEDVGEIIEQAVERVERHRRSRYYVSCVRSSIEEPPAECSHASQARSVVAASSVGTSQ